MGIAYALISMIFAGVNDFLFRQYIVRPRQRLGLFIAGIGVVWAAWCGAGLLFTHTRMSLAFWPITVGAGVCSLVANVFFIGAFRVYPAGVGATIYRLNLVIVAVLSFVWLGEAITAWKLIGIALGVAAVLLLGLASSASGLPARGMVVFVFACVLRALMGILYKLASTYGIPPFATLTIGGMCWLLGGLAYAAVYREAWHGEERILRYSLASGLLVVGITSFMLAATRYADASIAIPVTQMSFVVTTVLGVTLHREPFNLLKFCALAAAAGCIVSISRG